MITKSRNRIATNKKPKEVEYKILDIPLDIPVYGTFTVNAPTESDEQKMFFAWLRKYHPKIAACASSVRNEGRRTWGQIKHQKAEGLNKGTSDTFIPGSPSFCCEFKKRIKSAKATQSQIDYLRAAQRNGSFICIALGFDGAVMAFEEWRGR